MALDSTLRALQLSTSMICEANAVVFPLSPANEALFLPHAKPSDTSGAQRLPSSSSWEFLEAQNMVIEIGVIKKRRSSLRDGCL
jgi:hypothetical protein